MGIVTKKGDLGKTTLASGGTISKGDEVVEAYGTLDELVSSIGFARNLIPDEVVAEELKKLQSLLFLAGTELAKGKSRGISAKEVRLVEKLISDYEKKIKKVNGFVVPGDSLPSSALDVSRTVCRRLERLVVRLSEKGEFYNDDLLVFLNRFSDLLYIFARYCAGRDFVVILSTAPSTAEAKKLSQLLVKQKLVACSAVLPAIESHYKWKGKTFCEKESLLIIKTRQALVPKIKAAIKKHHSYECPEFVVLPITDGLPKYLEWIVGSV